MKQRQGQSDGDRLSGLLHQLHGVLGPSPEDFVDIDLPRHQLRALFVLVKAGPMSVGGLAEQIDASLASTSSLADRLARSGHIEREPDPADRRRVLLSVTPAGQEMVDRFEARFHERFERLVGAMDADARAALETGLSDMIRAADELGMRTHTKHTHTHQGDRA